MRKEHRVGERFTTIQGYEVEIVQYKNANNVKIRFLDTHRHEKTVQYKNILTTKNPYHPTLCGMGCIGDARTSNNGKKTREYQLWSSMINRCYNEKKVVKKPTYAECKVCERWLCFEHFVEDLPHIEGYEMWRQCPNQYISLDKDIKISGNKEYRLEACMFVQIEENARERMLRVSNPNTPIKIIGVKTDGDGTLKFDSLLEANSHFKKTVHSHISRCLQGKQKHAHGYYWSMRLDKDEVSYES